MKHVIDTMGEIHIHVEDMGVLKWQMKAVYKLFSYADGYEHEQGHNTVTRWMWHMTAARDKVQKTSDITCNCKHNLKKTTCKTCINDCSDTAYSIRYLTPLIYIGTS